MTWKEVKEQIEAAGVTDDMDLWYIDISYDGDLFVIPQIKDDKSSIGFTVTN